MKKALFIFIVFLGFVMIPDALLFGQDSLSTAPADTSTAVGMGENIVPFKEFFSVSKIISIIIVLVFTYFLNRVLVFLLGAFAEKQSSYRLLLKRMVPFLNVILWSLAIFIVIAGIIDPPIETVLTVGASIGIAVGFAAQDILKNIFGGFIIILDRPFQVGDKIDVDDHYGEVVEIGLRSTRIVTPDDSLVTIPNADIVSNAVSNSNSGELDCQVVTSIFLPASTDVDRVKEIAYKAAVSSRYVYLKKPVVIVTDNKVFEKNFVIELKVKAYVLDIRYEFQLKSEITELILTELKRLQMIAE